MRRMMCCVAAVLLSGVASVVPAGAQEAPAPGGANLMKLAEGEVGTDSVRIRVQHDPATFRADGWNVVAATPGEPDSAAELACDWTASGAPADEAGLFFCDLLNLPEGNHFLTLQAINVDRTDPVPNTYLWHTVGAATAIVDRELPGAFATNGAAGTWSAGGPQVISAQPQRLDLQWQPHAASSGQFSTVGYLIEVQTATEVARYAADRTALELFLPPSVNGDATISVFPVTSRGLINDPDVLDLTIEDRVARYQNALTIDQIVSAPDFEVGRDSEILRYYVAYFNRQPDVAGAKYWLDIRRQGFGPLDIAGFMALSDEFANNYEGTSDEEYLTAVYRNVLGRDFDQGGFDYWLDTLGGSNATGNNEQLAQLSRSEVVFYIARSAEFINNNPFG